MSAVGQSRRVPRLIVEVRGGRSNGLKAVIDPGGALRFGRTEIADVTVPHDEMLSSVHFELSWDGERCMLRDRKSISGTELNGEPVLRSSVSHGGWIRAGKTDFVVYVEGHSAMRDGNGNGDDPDDGKGDDPGDSEYDEFKEGLKGDAEGKVPALGAPGESERRAAAERALLELRAESQREPLYAILDAARDERILPILRESVERHQSLYEGVDGEALEDVAPYLVGPMRPDSMLLDRLVLEGWGKRWGIFPTSGAPFKEVRRHFRRLLMMVLEDTEERVYFRFYDPWVLENLAETGDDQEVLDEQASHVHHELEGTGGRARRALRFDRSRFDARRFTHLAAKVEERWDADIVDRFSTAYAETEDVRHDVTRLLHIGLRCGFDRGPDLAAFVDLALFARPDWLSTGEPPKELLGRSLPPHEKLDRLAQLAGFEPDEPPVNP